MSSAAVSLKGKRLLCAPRVGPGSSVTLLASCWLGSFALEAGLLMTGGCFGFGGAVGGREALIAVLLLGHLLAEGLELLCFGAEAADLYARGFLGE